MSTTSAKPLAWIKPQRSSPLPMQAQISRWLESLIASGQLGVGDRLPAETMLVEKLGVSRVTVRLAIDDLVSRGLISRSHGKGSFVTSGRLQHDLRSDDSFFDILLAKSASPEARLLKFAPAVPPPKIAAMFGLASGEKAVSLERLFLSAGRPVVLGNAWLTPDSARLSRADIESRSTGNLHSEILLHPVTASATSIGAELAGRKVASVLGIRYRSAVLVLTRSRFDARGLIREYNRFTIDPTSYEFTLSTDQMIPISATMRVVAA